MSSDEHTTVCGGSSRDAAGSSFIGGLIESGVEWLGLVPAHWTVSKLKFTDPVVESGTSVNAMDIVPRIGEVGVLKTGAASKGYFDPNESKTVWPAEIGRVSCPVQQGSLLVNRANTPALVGTTAYVDSSRPNLFLSDKLWQVSFARASERFVWWWSKTSVYRMQVESLCVGASSSMQNLAQENFRALYIALPSIGEQRAIADYLDEQTAKIDALIAKQERFIEVLRERRVAVVTHAITTGLDTAVAAVESGVEWLGLVPAHWTVSKLKFTDPVVESGTSVNAMDIVPGTARLVF